jgi:hypothetical protein
MDDDDFKMTEEEAVWVVFVCFTRSTSSTAFLFFLGFSLLRYRRRGSTRIFSLSMMLLFDFTFIAPETGREIGE